MDHRPPATDHGPPSTDQRPAAVGTATTPSFRSSASRLALVAAILLTMIAGWLFSGGGLERLWPRPSGPPLPGDVGQPAPRFSLETADGRQIRLDDLRGKVVLLNFW